VNVTLSLVAKKWTWQAGLVVRSRVNLEQLYMSNPNGLLSQKVCHYLDQGRTLNDILLRAAHSMAYFDLSKLNLA